MMFNKNRNKTFKPKKKLVKGTKQYELYKHAQATLGISQNLRNAVKLPDGEDINEWLAVHTIDFFNQINLLFGSVEEFCSEKKYPEMNAGPNYVYLWADGEEVKKPISVPARVYVEYLFDWIRKKFDDESIFPTSMDQPFPKNFRVLIATIFKRMFRVLAFIYVHQFHKIQELNEEAHLNAVFKHFMFFVDEFDLIDKREKSPLAELIQRFDSSS